MPPYVMSYKGYMRGEQLTCPTTHTPWMYIEPFSITRWQANGCSQSGHGLKWRLRHTPRVVPVGPAESHDSAIRFWRIAFCHRLQLKGGFFTLLADSPSHCVIQGIVVLETCTIH